MNRPVTVVIRARVSAKADHALRMAGHLTKAGDVATLNRVREERTLSE